MSTDNTLADLVEKMVAEKTFNLDAVKSLKVKAGEQDKELAQSRHMLAHRGAEIRSLSQRIQVLETEARQPASSPARQLASRELAVAERENKVTELEKNEAVAKAQYRTLHEVFGTIFKNPTVRENNLRQVPFTHTAPGGYSSTEIRAVPDNIVRTFE